MGWCDRAEKGEQSMSVNRMTERVVLRLSTALGVATLALSLAACGLLGGNEWDRYDICRSLFPADAVDLPAGAHRAAIPTDAAYVSVRRTGTVRVSTGEEMPLPVSSNEEIVTFASTWVAANVSHTSRGRTELRGVDAIHVVLRPGGLVVDGREHTRESMVEYLADRLEQAPHKPVGVSPDPDCTVDEVLAVLEVLAFAPDHGLPEPRRALATRRFVENVGPRLGSGDSPAIGPVVESRPGWAGTVVLRVESGTPYRLVDPVVDALTEARALTVIFETRADGKPESGPPARLPGGIPWSLEPEGTGADSKAVSDRQAAADEDRVEVVKQVQFRPPPGEMHQLAAPRTRDIAVADPTPDEPEPVRGEEPRHEVAPAQPDDLDLGVPDAPPPSRASGPMRFKVGGPMTEPRKIAGPEPLYPEAARRARIQGVVVLEVVVRTTGEADNVKVLRGLPLGLTEAAVEAVKQWRYEPSRLDGEPVDVLFVVTVRFNLSSE
jgi:TonB family protein